jgi:hypothetical protein
VNKSISLAPASSTSNPHTKEFRKTVLCLRGRTIRVVAFRASHPSKPPSSRVEILQQFLEHPRLSLRVWRFIPRSPPPSAVGPDEWGGDSAPQGGRPLPGRQSPLWRDSLNPAGHNTFPAVMRWPLYPRVSTLIPVGNASSSACNILQL